MTGPGRGFLWLLFHAARKCSSSAGRNPWYQDGRRVPAVVVGRKHPLHRAIVSDAGRTGHRDERVELKWLHSEN